MVVSVHAQLSEIHSLEDSEKVKQQIENIFSEMKTEHISTDLKY
ncbi:MAG: hypothetical protein WD431_00175 [Cyclobacteriaceae bacterium]